MEDLRRKTLLLAQQPEQKMLRANMFMAEPLRFFRPVRQNTLAFVTEREIDRRRNFFPHGRVGFNLLANGFDCGVGPQKPIRQRFVLTQQTEQKMLRLNIRTSELARFVSRKKDNAARFFGISLKHKCHHQDGLRLASLLRHPAIPSPMAYAGRPLLTLRRDRSEQRNPDYELRKRR